jgi:membrane-associated phospholipid phosphatase
MPVRSGLLVVFLNIGSMIGFAQPADTVSLPKTIKDSVVSKLKSPVSKTPIDLRDAIVPAALISYGVAALFSGPLNKLNYIVREEVYYKEGNRRKVPIDNYTLAAPVVAVYALNIAGVKGRNNLIDRSIILGLANLAGNGSGFVVKEFGHVLRPDSSDKFSFPSGHTFNAFIGAEFLRQEYKDVSPWIGVAGYVVAATTGYLRMYNDKHWLNDVVAGAGIGIISTRIAYWVYPTIKRAVFRTKKASTMVLPSYSNGYCGIIMVHYFE